MLLGAAAALSCQNLTLLIGGIGFNLYGFAYIAIVSKWRPPLFLSSEVQATIAIFVLTLLSCFFWAIGVSLALQRSLAVAAKTGLVACSGIFVCWVIPQLSLRYPNQMVAPGADEFAHPFWVILPYAFLAGSVGWFVRRERGFFITALAGACVVFLSYRSGVLMTVTRDLFASAPYSSVLDPIDTSSPPIYQTLRGLFGNPRSGL